MKNKGVIARKVRWAHSTPTPPLYRSTKKPALIRVKISCMTTHAQILLLKPAIDTVEPQYDGGPEHAGVESMEADGNIMGDNPEILNNVIGEVDNLRDQVDAMARGLDVVRHDLGEIQYRIQQNPNDQTT